MAIQLNPGYGLRKGGIMDPVCEQEGLLIESSGKNTDRSQAAATDTRYGAWRNRLCFLSGGTAETIGMLCSQ
ncbi:MAG TPA: hypothetical protein PLI53_11450 [Geobacteraceae bacterium]|nr:hypothetical protein [Geobacteraceae bacterium]